jgi:predicted RNA methylase
VTDVRNVAEPVAGLCGEYGDFQTPSELAADVLDLLRKRKTWTRVLEPCCGIGNFLVEAVRRLPRSVEVRGIEIRPEYVQVANRRLAEAGQTGGVVAVGDVFQLDAANVRWTSDGSLLVIGNPPWVTNSAQGLRGSENVPSKSLNSLSCN